MRQEGGDLKDRINQQWAARKGLVHKLDRKLTKAEKKILDRAQTRLEKKMESEHWNSDDSEMESEDEKPRMGDRGETV